MLKGETWDVWTDNPLKEPKTRAVQSEFFGRAKFNPPTAATVRAIFKTSPGRNGSAPMRSDFAQPTRVTRASQAQPPAKIITSPETSAAISFAPLVRSPEK